MPMGLVEQGFTNILLSLVFFIFLVFISLFVPGILRNRTVVSNLCVLLEFIMHSAVLDFQFAFSFSLAFISWPGYHIEYLSNW